MCASQGSNKNRFPRARQQEKFESRFLAERSSPARQRRDREKNIVADKSFGTGRWIVFFAVYNNFPWFLVIVEEVVEKGEIKEIKTVTKYSDSLLFI